MRSTVAVRITSRSKWPAALCMAPQRDACAGHPLGPAACDVESVGICRIGIDLSKINVDLQEAFAIEHFIVEIVISRTQQLFKGSLHLVVFGTSLQADLNIDASRQDFFLDAVLGEVRKFVTGVLWLCFFGCCRALADLTATTT